MIFIDDILQLTRADGYTSEYGSPYRINDVLTYADFSSSLDNTVVYMFLLDAIDTVENHERANIGIYFAKLCDFDFNAENLLPLQADLKAKARALHGEINALSYQTGEPRYTFGYDDFAENVVWCCMRLTIDDLMSLCVERPREKSEGLQFTFLASGWIELVNNENANPAVFEISVDGGYKWNVWDGSRRNGQAGDVIMVRNASPEPMAINGTDIVSGGYWQFQTKGIIRCEGDVSYMLCRYASLVTTLPDCAFRQMFAGTSIISIPKLPDVSDLSPYCFNRMFQDCDMLSEDVHLPDYAIVAEYSCAFMFENCTSLRSVNGFGGSVVMERGCMGMFKHCYALVKAMESLNATNGSEYMYERMFMDCEKLLEVPNIMLETTSVGCCMEMFRKCASMMSSPKLLSTDVAQYAYAEMFSGCSMLKEVYTLMLRYESQSLKRWLADVSAAGILLCSDQLVLSHGDDGLPNGWTRVNI